MESLSGLVELASTAGGLTQLANTMMDMDTFSDVRTKIWALPPSTGAPGRHTPVLWLMHRV